VETHPPMKLDALMGACRNVTGGVAVPQSDA
jgi:hypothetical protein